MGHKRRSSIALVLVLLSVACRGSDGATSDKAAPTNDAAQTVSTALTTIATATDDPRTDTAAVPVEDAGAASTASTANSAGVSTRTAASLGPVCKGIRCRRGQLCCPFFKGHPRAKGGVSLGGYRCQGPPCPAPPPVTPGGPPR